MPMVVGAPLLLLLFAASAFPWLLVLRARFGQLFAVPATAGGALLLLLVTLVISHLLRANYVGAIIVASVVSGAVGALIASRTPQALRRPGRYAVALWCPALLGPVLWASTVIVAQFLPGASRFGWVMNGDALNNLYLAGSVANGNGIVLGSAAYPVPLPTAIIAVALGSGSGAPATAAASLAHQLSAFELAWVVLLGAFCVALGAVTACLIPKTHLRAVVIVSAIGSLLPLTWFVSGLTIQWGYFNVALVLPLLLGAWLIYLESSRIPFASLVALIAFATVALATWTPVAIIVIALGAVVVLRHYRVLVSVSGRQLGTLAIVLGFGLVFFVFVSLPAFQSEGAVLAATGAGFTGFVDLWWVVPLLAVLLLATALLVRRRTELPTTSGAITVLVGGALCAALLLFESGDESFEAYYPKKFAWIVVVFLGALAVSFLFGAFAGQVRTTLIASIALLSLFASAILPPGTWPEVLQRQPPARILGDYVRHDGEATVREILRLTTADHSTVLWQSGDADEPIINEWLLLSHGGLAFGNKKLITLVGSRYFLYRTGGRYADPDVKPLCEILPLLQGAPRVITANRALSAELRSTCPGAPARVVVAPPLPGKLPARTGENWQSDGIEGPFH